MPHLRRFLSLSAIFVLSLFTSVALAAVLAPKASRARLNEPGMSVEAQRVQEAVQPPASTYVDTSPSTTDPVGTDVEDLGAPERISPPDASPPDSSDTPSPPGLESPDTRALHPVVVIGDSLTVGAKGFYLAASYVGPISVDAEIGRSSRTGLEVLKRTDLPDDATLVFALGTNDSDSYQKTSATVDAVLKIAGGSRRVIMLTLWRRGPMSSSNRAIQDATARWPNLEVVDWAAIVATDQSILDHDAVHYFSRGYKLLAQTVLSRLVTTT